MKFSSPLIKATLVKRYKRFLADCTLENGETVTAHCPNSGRMTGLDSPGFVVWLSEKTKKADGLKYGMEIVDIGDCLVGINTMHPNHIVGEALVAKQVAEINGYTTIRREVPYGSNSRIDFLLQGDGLPDFYLEIKNVHLKRGKHLEFPDAVSERAAKHMRDLSAMKALGHRAAVMFLCQREDGDTFEIARDIDPAYYKAFTDAIKSGVEVLCYKCKITTSEITFFEKVRVLV